MNKQTCWEETKLVGLSHRPHDLEGLLLPLLSLGTLPRPKPGLRELIEDARVCSGGVCGLCDPTRGWHQLPMGNPTSSPTCCSHLHPLRGSQQGLPKIQIQTCNSQGLGKVRPGRFSGSRSEGALTLGGQV